MKPALFAIIGGDKRYAFAADYLRAGGAEVCVFGFDHSTTFQQDVIYATSLPDATQDADYIILPLPCTVKDGFLPVLGDASPVSVKELLSAISPGQMVFGGIFDTDLQAAINKAGAFCYDYADCEEFAVLNAIPTAEGAIEIAMRELPITLHDANCLVIGFGRIAKILCQKLQGLGVHVSASARKERDLAFMQAFGYNPIHIKDLSSHIGKAQLIINTVPQLILTHDLLQDVKQNALIIDLASRPGGVDFDYAKAMGLKVIHALSLPGKVAPQTAAEIICKTIISIIERTVNI